MEESERAFLPPINYDEDLNHSQIYFKDGDGYFLPEKEKELSRAIGEMAKDFPASHQCSA